MTTIEQMKQDLALSLNEQAIKNREQRILKAIFKDIDGSVCDCETCPFSKECEMDNPDFDANYCKRS